LRLCPAESVAGSETDERVKALLEVLRSVICTSVEPEFLMDTCCEAALPIVTSPKSTEAGVAITGSAFAEENVFEFELQPESAKVSRHARAVIAVGPERSVDDWICRRASDFSKDSKKKLLRSLLIRRHLSRAILCFGQPMQWNPAKPAAG